jgi:hypothetical protein
VASFIEDLSAQGWSHHSSPGPFSREEIRMQIEYCTRKGYCIEVDRVIDMPGKTETERFLKATPKTVDHMQFLEKLAREVKRPTAFEKKSDADDEQKPAVGE